MKVTITLSGGRKEFSAPGRIDPISKSFQSEHMKMIQDKIDGSFYKSALEFLYLQLHRSYPEVEFMKFKSGLYWIIESERTYSAGCFQVDDEEPGQIRIFNYGEQKCPPSFWRFEFKNPQNLEITLHTSEFSREVAQKLFSIWNESDSSGVWPLVGWERRKGGGNFISDKAKLAFRSK